MYHFKSICFSLLFFLITCSAFGQERCGTVPYNQLLKDRNQVPANDQVFENWLKKKIQERKAGRHNRQKAGPYKIPVVVHVIHKGEPEGTGTNISDEQIISQISVLNEDFRRMNADAINTPALFTPLAGSMDIEFVLAKQDPEGVPSDGIVRVRGSKPGWTANDNYELKSQSYWPSEKYLNIWVCDLTDDLVGYAQFPESTLLPGLENASNNALTDGVVSWYKSFGSVDDGPFDLNSNFNKGRTVTHEIGHFFGLRHIWGDDSGSCSGTDYVDDTPNQSSGTTGCPAHPKKTCGDVISMFQNFLDYTNDACMNLFTKGQIDRMIIIIENSPRRASLLTSPGAQTPVAVANDLGLRQIISPLTNACSPSIIPGVEVRNYGNNTVTAVRIEVLINGNLAEVRNFPVSLSPLSSTALTFASLTAGFGNNIISFNILETNGVADGRSGNNTLSQQFFVFEQINPPFFENFGSLPPAWVIDNPDQLITWQLANAPNETMNNTALFLNFSQYEESYGEQDIIFSPVLDFSNAQAALLSFDVAHARFGASNDQLRVVVLVNCESLANGTIVYEKAGSALATTSLTGDFFVPSGAGDWRKETISLNQFQGESYIQLAFVGINDWGNNLYLDNISLVVGEFQDLALQNMISPSLVTCNENSAPLILVRNIGTIPTKEFKIEVSVNNAALQTTQVNGIDIPSNENIKIELPSVEFQPGMNSLRIKVSEPNGVPDENPANNEQTFTVIVNNEADRIPLRENFDDTFEPRWTLVSPSGGMNWQTVTTNFNTSLYYNAYANTNLGEEAWLVSPALDFSRTDKASVVFDVSSATRMGRQETLRILASRDCGDTYEQIKVIKLSQKTSDEPWTPTGDTDWEKDTIVNLNNYAGEEEVRIAFAITNNNGNNLYLDNIRFFTTDAPNTLKITDRYSIYGYSREDPAAGELKLIFNLEQRQDVPYMVVDLMGRIHADGVLTDVLNQTYPLGLEEKLRPGIYIVRMKIAGKYVAERILIP